MIMYKRSMPVMRTGTSFVFYFNTPLLHSAVAFHEYRELVVSLQRPFFYAYRGKVDPTPLRSLRGE
jgi:hypothetical protein